MESVADYPNLFAELIRRGWTDDMLAEAGGAEPASRHAQSRSRGGLNEGVAACSLIQTRSVHTQGTRIGMMHTL